MRGAVLGTNCSLFLRLLEVVLELATEIGVQRLRSEEFLQATVL